jgi:hypothetical protein
MSKKVVPKFTACELDILGRGLWNYRAEGYISENAWRRLDAKLYLTKYFLYEKPREDA